MRTIILSIAALVITSASFGSTIIRYDYNAINLLTAVHNNCQVEFIQAMKGANRVGSATYTDDRTGVRNYVIKTIGGGYPPSFVDFDVATLTMTMTPIVEENPPLDKPQGYNVTCFIEDTK